MYEDLHIPMYSCTYSGNRCIYNYSDERNYTIGLFKIETVEMDRQTFLYFYKYKNRNGINYAFHSKSVQKSLSSKGILKPSVW